jgi:putative acetyltransferase
MRIRRSTVHDARELSRLRKGTIRAVNKHDYTPEQIRIWSRTGNTARFRRTHGLMLRFVAVEDGAILGFIDVKKDDPHELYTLYVHKDHVRKGIGTRLMAKMEREVLGLGVRRWRLESTVTAKTFYEKHGFHVVRRLKNRKTGEAFLMEKLLTA